MAKIETYILATQPLSFSDMLIGTEVGGPIPNATKNFSLGELYNLFASLPAVGNLQQTLNAGNTATQNIFLTGDITSTNIKPTYIIDGLNTTGAVGEVLIRSFSGISWGPIPPATIQQVLNAGNTATQNIILTGNITSTQVIPGNIKDGLGNLGTTGQILSKTSTGIQWINNVAGVQDLQSVLNIGNTATANIILTGNITSTNLSGTNTGDQTTITGNAGTATVLQTARIIGTLTGDASSAGSSFNGAADNTNALTLATVNTNVGSFTNSTITVNAKGLVTAASSGASAVTTVTATTPLSSSGGSTPNLTIQQSSGSQNGYLSGTDWTTFNNKQPAGNYITSLTGEATGTGPGATSVILSNAAVIGKLLTGLSITGSTISSSDNILTAFGKVQNQINGLIGGVQFQGVWNAATNTPALVSSVGTQGYYYIVDVAGNTNLNGISDWQVGDWAIFNGSTWNKVDNTDLVTSVNGQVGAVSLTTDNIPEGATNLYYLDSRARAALSFVAGSGAYNGTTGVITIPTNNSQILNGAGYITLVSLSATSPLSYNNTTGAFSIQVANTTQNGYLSSTDWNTFNGKQPFLGGTGLVKSVAGVISYITDNSANWNTAYNDSIVSAAVTGTATKTLTLNQQDGGTITASWSDIDTGLTSVGVSMPSAFSVANSPLITNGTIAITGAGVASQYIRGDGTLANFPTSGGGGASVSYYLNGSVSQGTIGGVAYKEMNSVPVIGAGTDFTINANGYIAQFITDVGDPNKLLIPAGNWNFETYFSASSSGGTPRFYIELYKYDGAAFTLIASNSATPEYITGGTAIDLYFTALAVPATTLLATDRLAVRFYVIHSGRTITMHTENSHLSQIITTFSTGLTTLNGLTSQAQYFAVGTTGTDFNISSATDTHTFNLPTASATNRGALSSADWTTFNSKQNSITLTTTGTSGAATLVGATLNVPQYADQFVGTVTSVAALTLGTTGTDLSSSVVNSTTTPVITLNVPTASAANRGALSSADWSTFNTKVGGVTATTPLFSSGGSTPNITIQQASGSQAGYLSSTDWTTFNNKQVAGNYITSLTGEATATGPGAAAVTLDNASVTAKILTGVNITGGTVLATDTMLTAFGKLQNQVNGLIGGSIYQGTWNASTNTPTLTSSVGTAGYYYIVSVAGTTNLNGITDWQVGDWAIFNGGVWQKVDNTDAVVSVNGQTGAVSLTTDNISEGVTNLYFTNTRARAALSFVAGSGAYNSSTGAITIPTNTSQLTNGANFITLASLSGTAPISYNSGTGAISITQAGTASNGYLSSTDWNTFNNKQGTITLTTTGTSGAATFSANTLNIPNYGSALSGYLPLTGGTLTGALSGTSASFSENGSSFGSASAGSYPLTVQTNISEQSIKFIGKNDNNNIQFFNSANTVYQAVVGTIGTDFIIGTGTSGTTRLTIASTGAASFSGAVAIGKSTAYQAKLDVVASSGAAYAASNSNLDQLLIGSAERGVASFFGLATGSTYILGLGNGISPSMGIGTYGAADLILATNNTARLTIASTGAATFSSSVNVNGEGTYIGIDAIATPRLGFIKLSGAQPFLGFAADPFTIKVSSGSTIATSNTFTTALSIATTGAATFSGNVLLNQTTQPLINFQTSGIDRAYISSTNASLILNSLTGNDIRLQNNGTTNLTIAGTTGAATFSSSVTATSFIPSGATVPTNGMYLSAANTLNFATNTTNRLTINSSGNLGLGVTPTTSTAARFIQFGAGAALNTNSTNNSNFWHNTTFDASGNALYAVTGQQSSFYRQINGAHQWFYAAAGTAGNAITFTQQMTLFANGNLAVGTTTDAGYKLDVNGTGRVSGVLSANNTITIGNGVTAANSSISLLGVASVSYTWSITNDANGLSFGGGTNPSLRLNGATGAATFSSSVTAGGIIYTNAGYFKVENTNWVTSGESTNLSSFTSGTETVRLFTYAENVGGYAGFGIKTLRAGADGLATRLFISSTGAATFSSKVNATNFETLRNGSASVSSQFQLSSISGTTYSANIQLGAAGSMDFWTYDAASLGWGKYLSIASTGAATFSGAVAIGTALASGSALTISNTTNSRQFQFGYSTGAGYNYFQVYDGTSFQALVLNNALTLASTGAATFTSSVTATQGNFNQIGNGFAINMTNRNNNQTWGLVVDTDAVDDKILGFQSSYGFTPFYALKLDAVGGAATFSSSIKTAAPSGGTAKPFKIGAAATVTPTLQNRTIEIEIDGVTYYLTAKTTNN